MAFEGLKESFHVLVCVIGVQVCYNELVFICFLCGFYERKNTENQRNSNSCSASPTPLSPLLHPHPAWALESHPLLGRPQCRVAWPSSAVRDGPHLQKAGFCPCPAPRLCPALPPACSAPSSLIRWHAPASPPLTSCFHSPLRLQPPFPPPQPSPRTPLLEMHKRPCLLIFFSRFPIAS